MKPFIAPEKRDLQGICIAFEKGKETQLRTRGNGCDEFNV